MDVKDIALNVEDFGDVILKFWEQENRCCRVSRVTEITLLLSAAANVDIIIDTKMLP